MASFAWEGTPKSSLNLSLSPRGVRRSSIMRISVEFCAPPPETMNSWKEWPRRTKRRKESSIEAAVKAVAVATTSSFLTANVTTQRMLDHGLQNPAAKGDTPISIEGLAKELLRDSVYHHIAWPSIKGHHLLGCGSRGNSGEISNASKVLQDA